MDSHSQGKQTYRCGDCRHRFTPGGNRHYYPEAVKRQAVDMYGEGTGITATGRVLGVQQCSEPERRDPFPMAGLAVALDQYIQQEPGYADRFYRLGLP